ncbi:MAG: hypothetical protein R6U40_11855 [Desulfobacterales bacterium]
MKQLTPEEKKKLLSEAFWDKNIDTGRLYDLLTGRAEQEQEIDKKSVFSRLLSTYDWFTLMKLIPEDLLLEALSDDVISRLYPKQLRDRYAYARKILFK